MTDLFNTTITTDNHPVSYSVFFDNEAYHFHSAQEDIAKSFIVKREHDEWHINEDIGNELKNNAIASLEKYLLSQH